MTVEANVACDQFILYGGLYRSQIIKQNVKQKASDFSDFS